MYNTLDPNEARSLINCLGFYESCMKDSLLKRNTNAYKNYTHVLTKINLYTDPFMEATVYSVPGVVPPTS